MDEAAFIARFQQTERGEQAAHPGPYVPRQTKAADWRDFAAVLNTVGGSLLSGDNGWRTAVQGVIDFDAGPVIAVAAAQPLLAGVTGWGPAGDPALPLSWETVGLGILVAELACAENAAVLLSSRSLPERGLAFLAQRLLVLVPRDRLVADFITAQNQAAALLQAHSDHHLTWMSGPSKTADIEQCLVIGAHGARSLIVAAYDP
ncbi:hypothetical protein LBMAG53_37400 [Planctomycetota bacterium]|nr:hypothetical protein LBMAG53_37400 [Planctomycetota bacterium]